VITGIRSGNRASRRRILFGFEGIRGFPVDYSFWCRLLNPLMTSVDVDDANRSLPKYFRECLDDPDWLPGPEDETWRATEDVDAVLKRHLFVEHDQVVVPSLNLKAAKEVICHDERQKRVLRRMGFIEDRIKTRRIVQYG
jgi:hypothetical protein